MRKQAGIRLIGGILLLAVFLAAVELPVRAEELQRVKIGYSASGRMIRKTGNQFSGYGASYLRSLAKYTDWSYLFVPVTEENRIEKLKNGEIDLLCDVDAKTGSQEGLILSTKESGMEYGMLCARKDNNEVFYNDGGDLDGSIIAINRNSGMEPILKEYAQQKGFSYECLYYGDYEKAIAALDSGEADLALVSNLRDTESYKYVAKMGIIDLYFATGAGNEALMEQLNAADKELKKEKPFIVSDLYEEFYGDPDQTLFGMSRTEYQLIQSNDRIKVAYPASNYPVEYYDKDTDSYKGVYADAMRLIAEESGLKFEYIPFDDIRDAWKQLEYGDIDLITAGYGNASDLGYKHIRYTEPYLDIENTLVGRNEGAFSEIAVIALPEAYIGQQSYIARLFPDQQILLLKDEEECMRAVSQGKADLTVINTIFLQTVYNLNNYNNLVILPAQSIKVPMRVAVGKHNGELLEQIINKAIYRIPDSEFEQCIVQNAINISYEPSAEDIVRRFLPHLAAAVFLVAAAVLIFLKSKERHFRHMALTDSLTGLWNGIKFRKEAELILNRNKQAVYMMISLDIDKFKFINSDFGPKAADEILRVFAERIREEFRGEAIFARDMADLFLIMLPPRSDLEEKLMGLIHPVNFRSNGKETDYNISLKFGIYEIAARTAQAESAAYINYAVIARKSIKNAGAHCLAYYDKRMADSVAYEILIEKNMEKALDEEEFEVYYQPKYDLKTEGIAGAEALVRWKSREMGFIFPDQFIPIFERNGFITELDFYVYDKTLAKLAEWDKAAGTGICISVNVSRAHLETKGFLRRLMSLTEKYGVPNERLELELTETVLGNKPDEIGRFMRECKDAGFKVSIDDFGSGYSSLNLLKMLPVDVLKIDKGFLDETEESERSSIIVEQVVQMARKIQIKTVCEGVETEKQAQFLKRIGCNMAQGYLYSRPVPAEIFEGLLQSEKKF